MGRTDERERHRGGSRWLVRGAGTAVAALVVAGLVPGTALAAPGDTPVAEAQAERDAAAARVGEIGAQLAQAQERVDAARRGAQIALQEYEVRRAVAELARGRAQVVAFARSSYMQGSTAPGAAALVSAEGPAQLVERAALLDAAGSHRVDVVTELTVLEQQAAAADDAAQVAVQAADEAEAAAAGSLAAAQSQEVSARAQAAELADRREVLEAELADAQVLLLGAEGAQAAAAAQAAATAAAQARPPAPASSAGSSSGWVSGSSSSGSSYPSSGGGSPTGTVTTAGAPAGSAVETAIAAAESQRGLPYSWGGGGSNGPSFGIPPDTDVYGFDCSGLTEYAYAQAGIRIGGTSREQYWRFRHQTVAAGDLQPGDLVFWGQTADHTSIYHVALYIGGGQVIQAPQSGDVVRISSMWFGSDYYGAVRPAA